MKFIINSADRNTLIECHKSGINDRSVTLIINKHGEHEDVITLTGNDSSIKVLFKAINDLGIILN